MSSCLQWNIGSDVKSSANMHPMAQISKKNNKTKLLINVFKNVYKIHEIEVHELPMALV